MLIDVLFHLLLNMQQIYSLFVAFIVKTLHKMQQIAILINAEANLPARRLSGG